MAVDVSEDAPPPPQLDSGIKVVGKSDLYALVIAAGRRAHDDLPVEDFVALAVVGKQAVLRVGALAGLGSWHRFESLHDMLVAPRPLAIGPDAEWLAHCPRLHTAAKSSQASRAGPCASLRPRRGLTDHVAATSLRLAQRYGTDSKELIRLGGAARRRAPDFVQRDLDLGQDREADLRGVHDGRAEPLAVVDELRDGALPAVDDPQLRRAGGFVAVPLARAIAGGRALRQDLYDQVRRADDVRLDDAVRVGWQHDHEI